MMWETKDYGYVHKISVKWYSNSLIKMKWTKEKKNNETSEMVINDDVNDMDE